MQEKIESLWENLRVVGKKTWLEMGNGCTVELDPNQFRLDDLGAIICKNEYGNETKFGWTIDHILPLSKGGTYHLKNLQLFHWSNNKLKGNDFPTFSWDTSMKIHENLAENYVGSRPRATCSDAVIVELRNLYPHLTT